MANRQSQIVHGALATLATQPPKIYAAARAALLAASLVLMLAAAAACGEANDQSVQGLAATAVASPTTAAAAGTQQSTTTASTPASTPALPTYTPVPPTVALTSDGHTWYTSAANNAQYYYCDLDDGWKTLSQSNLRKYDSEAALKDAFGRSRTKHPDSKC